MTPYTDQKNTSRFLQYGREAKMKAKFSISKDSVHLKAESTKKGESTKGGKTKKYDAGKLHYLKLKPLNPQNNLSQRRWIQKD